LSPAGLAEQPATHHLKFSIPKFSILQEVHDNRRLNSCVMLNVVLDTNILVAALKSRAGASNKVVAGVEAGVFRLHLSVPLVMEYEDVLKRPEHRGAFTMADIDKLIDAMCSYGVHHSIWYLWRLLLPDPKDEFVAELAVAARADYIVSFNQKDFRGMERFGIDIIRPGKFLHIL
jgi:putative PIN family toxin of toxin-antitoxin system